jgi:riboflavin synthase
MFTGLVEAMGTLSARRPSGPGAILELACPLGPLAVGESISVEGACLTVKRITSGGFEADVSAETLERTTLGALAIRAKVNLERSLPLGARMGGHLVTGHVDATCTLAARRPVGDATAMTFAVPPSLARLIAEKGSVAINGVSLTVNAMRDVTPPEVDVVIVPHTREVTSLGDLAVGGRVNLEVDLLARYVARILGAPREVAGAVAAGNDAAWMERLTRAGYV